MKSQNQQILLTAPNSVWVFIHVHDLVVKSKAGAYVRTYIYRVHIFYGCYCLNFDYGMRVLAPPSVQRSFVDKVCYVI